MTELTLKIQFNKVDKSKTHQEIFDSIQYRFDQVLNDDFELIIERPSIELIGSVNDIELFSKKNWHKFRDFRIESASRDADNATFIIDGETITVPIKTIRSGTIGSTIITSVRWIQLDKLLKQGYVIDYSINDTCGDDDIMYYSKKYKKIFFIENGDDINDILKY